MLKAFFFRQHMLILVVPGLLFFLRCNTTDQGKAARNRDELLSAAKENVVVKYARRFSVEQKNGYRLVTINQPWQGAQTNLYYALVSKNTVISGLPDSISIIEIPVQRLVCTSTTHLPSLEYLNETERLVGFPNTNYIYSKDIQTAVNRDQVKELGTEGGINMEILIALNPDLVVDFAMGAKYDKFRIINKLGIPVIINADYMEESPLGRAEWIKFMGLFFGKEKKADSIFTSIKNNYESMLALAMKASDKPSVFSGIVYGDIWFMPGGNNFGAKFLADAQGKYLWENDSTRGSLKLSFESVYDRAHQTDFWIGVGSVGSLNELAEMDSRYTRFKAYQNGHVYNYNNRVNQGGGNDFLESGYLRPDLILADLIKIIHPELLPDHQLYFYKKLE